MRDYKAKGDFHNVRSGGINRWWYIQNRDGEDDSKV